MSYDELAISRDPYASLEAPLAQSYSSGGGGGPTGGGGGGGGGGGMNLNQFHMLMRGRYPIAVILAAVLGAAGALGGYRMGKKTFRSTAIIQIAPVLQTVLSRTGEEQLTNYSDFVETQISIISSRRVTEAAMTDPIWVQSNPSQTDADILNFNDSVSAVKANQLIYINYVSEDPAKAQAGAQAVLNTYKKLVLEDDSVSGQRRSEKLQQLISTCQTNILSVQNRITDVARPDTPSEVLRKYELLSKKIDNLDLEISKQADQVSASAGGGSAGKLIVPETEREWAYVADKVYGFDLLTTLKERDILRERLDQMMEDFGANYKPRKDVEAKLNRTQTEIDDKIKEVKDKFTAQKPSVNGPTEAEQNQAKLVKMQAESDRLSDEQATLGQKQSQIIDLRAEQDNIKAMLKEAQDRMEQIRVESGAGRISVVSEGERPLAAYKDTRSRFAATGGIGGVVIGLGLVLAYGLRDDRVRHSRQASGLGGEMPPVLGLLPEVADEEVPPDQSAEVARSLHLIRTSLQLTGRPGRGQVIAVTGPLPGSGKTSVTLGLATSYGRSGAKTLMVDFDPIGRGLSLTVSQRIARRLGPMLLERNIITAEQLEVGLAKAERDGTKLGEALISLGFTTDEVIREELGRQTNSSAGVMDALRGEAVEACMVKTPYANVWLMPVGDIAPGSIGTVSPQTMRKLLDRLAGEFDTILLDTGPTPGCVESNIASAIADCVVVVLSRGDSRRSLGRTVAALRQVGGKCAGLVYNRAELEDFSESSSSVSRQLSRPEARLHKTLLVDHT